MFRFNPITGCFSFAPDYSPPGPPGEPGEPGFDGEQGPQGVQGEQGPKGDKGDRGPTGASGKDGKDGVGILSGTTPPSPFLGSVGAFYIDYIHWTIYGPKTADGWPVGIPMIGPQGEPGYDGLDGQPGEQGPPGPRGLQGVQGPVGPMGPRGPQGSQGPPGRVQHQSSSDTQPQRGWVSSGIVVQHN